MKLRLLHDEAGRILAAVDLRPGPDGGPGPRRPAGNGQQGIEVEVPEPYRHLDLAEICARLRVDPERGELCPDERHVLG